jgi:uncharacterized protein (TIGR03435 family)
MYPESFRASARALAVVVAFAIVVVNVVMVAYPQAKPGDASLPQFDVVSVKRNTSGGASPASITPGRASVTNITLRTLIQLAWQVQANQLVNVPDWVNTDRFDILATTSGGASVEQMRLMLRGLMADRFGLVVHMETREVPIYALTVARKDGKLGPNLHVSTVDCQANRNRPLDSLPQRGTTPVDPQQRCLILPMFARGRFQGRGLRMANVASALNNVVGRTVVDKTGLTDTFEFDLSWTPDQLLQPNVAPGGGQQAGTPGPSLFTAMEEQLGLKLESQKGPGEVLVIDKVEKPAEN